MALQAANFPKITVYLPTVLLRDKLIQFLHFEFFY